MIKEDKERCKLCGKYMMTPIKPKKWTKRVWEKYATVHVKGNLFGQVINEVFHEKCWKMLFYT
jgi:hypothetical protein